MKDLTNTTESTAPPPVGASGDCKLCGKPLLCTPKEIGVQIKEALDAIRLDLRETVGSAKAAGYDGVTVETIGRETLHRWCMTFFPVLEEASAELQGAHAACVIKATAAKRQGAS